MFEFGRFEAYKKRLCWGMIILLRKPILEIIGFVAKVNPGNYMSRAKTVFQEIIFQMRKPILEITFFAAKVNPGYKYIS